jgi:hypothetical protein
MQEEKTPDIAPSPHRKLFLRIAWIVGGLAALACLCSFLFSIPFLLMVTNDSRRIDEHQRVLLYQTDHAQLLAACRSAMQTLPVGLYEGEDIRLPQAIRAIKPHYVRNNKTEIYLEMGGGFFHYEFTVYAPGGKGRGVEVIPGLWYSNENGILPEP